MSIVSPPQSSMLPTPCQVGGGLNRGCQGPVPCVLLRCLTRIICYARISFRAVMKSENHSQRSPAVPSAADHLTCPFPGGPGQARQLLHHGPKGDPATEPGKGPRQEAQPGRVCRGVFGEFAQGSAQCFSSFQREWLGRFSKPMTVGFSRSFIAESQGLTRLRGM